jgi:ABC-2 type transport system ATP-binding protein
MIPRHSRGIITVENLKKSFGDSIALDDVSFAVNQGEIVAVVGPNGAGKSTLFNYLANVLPIESGTSRLNGRDLKDLSSAEIGFLSEHPHFYHSFSSLEMLLFENTMRDIGLKSHEIEELGASFLISDFFPLKMHTLSQGMAKRVSLAKTFMGKPSVIILDEPLNGLDIQSVLILKDQLIKKKHEGAHILLSSHVLNFLDGLVDRIIFLERGRIVHISNGADNDVESIYKQLFISA